MFVEIGDTTPNGRKSNCLADPSGKLNQLEANLLLFPFPSTPAKLLASPLVLFCEGFEWNGRDYPDLLSSLHDIPHSRLTV